MLWNQDTLPWPYRLIVEYCMKSVLNSVDVEGVVEVLKVLLSLCAFLLHLLIATCLLLLLSLAARNCLW